MRYEIGIRGVRGLGKDKLDIRRGREHLGISVGQNVRGGLL